MLLWGDNGRSQEIGDRTQDAGVRRSERKDRMQRAPFASPGALPSKDNVMLLMQWMADSSLRLIYDCRLPIFGGPAPLLWRFTRMLLRANTNAARRKLTKVAPEATMFIKIQVVRRDSGEIGRPQRKFKSLKESKLVRGR